MTEDRITTAISLCSDFVERLGAGLHKYGVFAMICFLSSVPLAKAEGISINKAEMRLSDNGYQLSASYDINLTFAAQHALSHGVPLYFIGEFQLTRPRWYWLDEAIYQGSHTIKLSYNVLTRQYRLSRGALFQNFANFEDAVTMLARQSSSVIPAAVLHEDSTYVVATRLRLDVASLPLPLQVNALTSTDWALDSDWHRWMVRPAEVMVRSKAE